MLFDYIDITGRQWQSDSAGLDATYTHDDAGDGCCQIRFPVSSAIWIPWAQMSDKSGIEFGPVPVVSPVVLTVNVYI